MAGKVYDPLIEHYEQCLAVHGPTARGMDWPNETDLDRRFEVMLGIVRDDPEPCSILDLGCGAGLLFDFIRKEHVEKRYSYYGIDLSEKMIAAASERCGSHHVEYRDILIDPFSDQSFDYVIMNGVLTERCGLGYDEMCEYSREIVRAAFGMARHGVAFNVMSSHVDWQREDLFHWPLDEAVGFLVKECSRNIVVRMDYGLYEYTIYLYRHGATEWRRS